MESKLNKWLSAQTDREDCSLRFLKSGEYTDVLNTFFEVKNRIPIALTAVGGIIYVEIFEKEILFSIFYPDQFYDDHLADSIEDFESFLETANSQSYYLHIMHCPIIYTKREKSKSYLKILAKPLGKLEPGEIYGYADEVFKNKIENYSEHYFENKEVTITARKNAQEYFASIIALFKLKPSNNKATYDIDSCYFLSFDITDDLKKYKSNFIKSGYDCFMGKKAQNLRSIANCDIEYLSQLKRLNYFSQAYPPSDIFSLLKNNRQLIGLSLTGNQDDVNEIKIASTEALCSFPLLKRFSIQNIKLSHFPEELTQLKNVEEITLLKTGTRSLPESLSTMTQLRELHLSGIPLKGKVDVICKLINLKKLTLTDCSITSLPVQFKQLSKLEELDLSKNPLIEIPTWIGELKHLKIVKLENCKLTSLPQSIADLDKIEELEIKGNSFTSLPKSLLKLKTKIGIEIKSKALYDEKVRKKLETAGLKSAVFIDFGFKLMVIEELMYKRGLLLPKFDLNQFVKNYKKRKIKIDEEYEMIPEVKNYFEKLEIPMILLDEITELSGYGGMKIYEQISPDWGGEGDYYNVHSAKDAKLLPNLKKVSLMNSDKKVLAAFQKMGIEVR